jgi:hypothetical protein
MRERGLMTWGFQRLPLVGGGAFPGGGIFNRNYGEFSTGVDMFFVSISSLWYATCVR